MGIYYVVMRSKPIDIYPLRPQCVKTQTCLNVKAYGHRNVKTEQSQSVKSLRWQYLNDARRNRLNYSIAQYAKPSIIQDVNKSILLGGLRSIRHDVKISRSKGGINSKRLYIKTSKDRRSLGQKKNAFYFTVQQNQKHRPRHSGRGYPTETTRMLRGNRDVRVFKSVSMTLQCFKTSIRHPFKTSKQGG